MSFSNTSSTIGNLFGANNNSVTTTTTTTGGPAEIIPQQRPSTNHHHYHHHTDGVTQISGARPNQKRQPHGGAKSHKLLDKASFKNLFVARLPRALTSNDTFLELFAHYHPVSATIMMNVETGQSKGFGFVTFETEAEGQLAFENLNNRKLRVTVAGDHNSTTDGKIVFFTPEIKPSTFNGHRIVVESPHVYIRNLPLALLFEEETASTRGVGASFSILVDFFSRFGEVQLMEFHGGQSLEDIVQTQQHGSVAPPVLVSFNSKEQASAAVSACHGKTLFPEHLTPALMAKFADMTTVKSINRHHKDARARTTTTGMVRHRSSRNNSSFDGSSSSAGGVEETFPFPSGPMLRSTHQSSAPQVLQSIVPLQRNFSEGSLPSPVAGASSSGLPPHPPHRRPSPPTEYWTPVVSTLLGGAGSNNQSGVVASGTTRSSQRASSSSSTAAESRRGSNSVAGSSHHSQPLLHLSTSQPAPPLYRNDPYNLSGYVMVTSSSSSSSSSSSFVVQE